MYHRACLAEMELPEFGLPSVEPVVSSDVYRARLARLAQRAHGAGYDDLVVYGDREHFANVSYLTGYDARFEETLLVLDTKDFGRGRRPAILVGNEGWSYVHVSPIVDDLQLVLFQSFSLPGQPRGNSQPLGRILAEAGITGGRRVGVAGWKPFGVMDDDDAAAWLEIPAYIADVLRGLAGPDNVRNANALLMDASSGLRVFNEVDQLARFEFAACYASQAVRNVLFGIQPGMTELEAVELMRLNGLPLSAHIVLGSGERTAVGMPSPSCRIVRRGDPLVVCAGLWGGLTSRAGFLVESASDLPQGIADYGERLVAPYFEAIVAWYETVGIGVAGQELYRAVHDRIGEPFFGVGLNPGHLIGLDEWVDSPIYGGSSERLASGMALQVDVIPATGTPYFTSNIEDGIALADEAMRAEFQIGYPEAWGRIQARRTFMQDKLGIHLRPEVLPFSNLPAYLPPFILAPRNAMCVA